MLVIRPAVFLLLDVLLPVLAWLGSGLQPGTGSSGRLDLGSVVPGRPLGEFALVFFGFRGARSTGPQGGGNAPYERRQSYRR